MFDERESKFLCSTALLTVKSSSYCSHDLANTFAPIGTNNIATCMSDSPNDQRLKALLLKRNGDFVVGMRRSSFAMQLRALFESRFSTPKDDGSHTMHIAHLALAQIQNLPPANASPCLSRRGTLHLQLLLALEFSHQVPNSNAVRPLDTLHSLLVLL